MLPFLQKRKSQSGVSVVDRSPDEKPESEQDDGSEGLKACAQDILRAIEQKDPNHLAEALRAAFQICDLEPHKEGPHEEESPHTYEAQNKKAAE